MDAAGQTTRFSGARLRRIRERRSLSQRDLARAVRVSQTTVHLAEVEKRIPCERNLRKIAEALEVAMADLFTEDGREVGS